ncbi:hypothetical protein BTM36_24085 [Herbaspirillum sp. VT-16-41]|nr:hypothetical protein BTM36_24085 [Herbaspirillum sp. VT-16-41]
MAWLVLLMFVQFMTSQAGVISAAAFAFSSLLPIGPSNSLILTSVIFLFITIVPHCIRFLYINV